jgi:superfamily II DNA/RNA helicase
MRTKVELDRAVKRELEKLLQACTEEIQKILKGRTFEELFKELVRRYAHKRVSNGETRHEYVTVENNNGSFVLNLWCDCPDDHDCECDKKSTLDFQCIATYNGDEVESTLIKLCFVNDEEGNSCRVSCVP